MNNFEQLERALDYQFTNDNLLDIALTHSSYANECGGDSYERLEFLGDAVIELVVSEYIYKFSELDSGLLSKLRAALVSTENLSKISTMLSIMQYVKKSRSLGSFGKKNTADIFESVVGAIYLDGGFESAKKLILKYVIIDDNNIQSMLKTCIDYKTKLQEEMQKVGKSFEYRVLNTSGLDHEKIFECALFIDGKMVSQAKNTSIRKAEESCAEKYYNNY